MEYLARSSTKFSPVLKSSPMNKMPDESETMPVSSLAIIESDSSRFDSFSVSEGDLFPNRTNNRNLHDSNRLKLNAGPDGANPLSALSSAAISAPQLNLALVSEGDELSARASFRNLHKSSSLCHDAQDVHRGPSRMTSLGSFAPVWIARASSSNLLHINEGAARSSSKLPSATSFVRTLQNTSKRGSLNSIWLLPSSVSATMFIARSTFRKYYFPVNSFSLNLHFTRESENKCGSNYLLVSPTNLSELFEIPVKFSTLVSSFQLWFFTRNSSLLLKQC